MAKGGLADPPPRATGVAHANRNCLPCRNGVAGVPSRGEEWRMLTSGRTTRLPPTFKTKGVEQDGRAISPRWSAEGGAHWRKNGSGGFRDGGSVSVPDKESTGEA